MTQQGSINLRAIGFVNDGPAAKDHPVPLEDVTWAMIARASLFVIAVAAVGFLAFAGLWLLAQNPGAVL